MITESAKQNFDINKNCDQVLHCKDLHCKILSYLDLKSLLKCQHVNHQFYNVSHNLCAMQHLPIRLLCDFTNYDADQFGQKFVLQYQRYQTEQEQTSTKHPITGEKFFHAFKQVDSLNLEFENFNHEKDRDKYLAQYEMFLPLFSVICANSHKITNLSVYHFNAYFPNEQWHVFASIYHFIKFANDANGECTDMLYHSNLVATRPNYTNLESIKLNKMVLNKSFQASSKLIHLELCNVSLSISFRRDLLNTSNIESLKT